MNPLLKRISVDPMFCGSLLLHFTSQCHHEND